MWRAGGDVVGGAAGDVGLRAHLITPLMNCGQHLKQLATAASATPKHPSSVAGQPCRTTHLWVQVCLADLLVQQLAHTALKLGADLLRLVADVEAGGLALKALQGVTGVE